MFKFVLVIPSFVPNSSPDAIATFKTEQHYKAVAFIANKGFSEQGGGNKAVCIIAMKHGEL